MLIGAAFGLFAAGCELASAPEPEADAAGAECCGVTYNYLGRELDGIRAELAELRARLEELEAP